MLVSPLDSYVEILMGLVMVLGRAFGKWLGHDGRALMNRLVCYTAAAAKSLQSCPTLCDPIDGSPPGSAVPGVLRKNAGVGCHFLLQCVKVKSEAPSSLPPGEDAVRCLLSIRSQAFNRYWIFWSHNMDFSASRTVTDTFWPFRSHPAYGILW